MTESTKSGARGNIPPAVAVLLAKASVEKVAGWLGHVDDYGDTPIAKASWRNLARLQASLRRMANCLDRRPSQKQDQKSAAIAAQQAPITPATGFVTAGQEDDG